ncbi:MAG: acylphosphatase [Pseudomonadota bacterium]
MQDKKQLHVIISGKVQGVFFRVATQQTARELGITGWVKNLPDGTVEAVFEGSDMEIQQMMLWCHSGPPGSRIDKISIKTSTACPGFSSFDIRY